MVAFGPWSTTLALGMGFGTLVAVLLFSSDNNRAANRCLAAFLIVLVLKLAPYALGFAGFYDAYPWLSFAPFSVGLALGPLLYLHVLRLTSSHFPRHWGWHLAPAALQLAYYLVMFVQPLPVKDWWNARVQEPWLSPAESAAELAMLGVYLALSIQHYRQYQAWLDAHLSNSEDYRLPWLRNALVALAVVLPALVAYEVASAALDFNYFQRYPLYLVVTALVLYLGLEGWRNADRRYPVREDEPAAPGNDDPPVLGASQASAGHDWKQQGEHWYAQLETAGWWRDPELSLDRLARHLGTNTRYLSRAFNDGLGLSFNTAVNRLRITAIQRELANPGETREMMALAHAAGFSSKTSFHRLFKAATGMTPAQFRAGAWLDSAKP
ncbi:MAG: helix-turn-helix transcriptional regulator [Pseudoxanthomonas sp.]